MKLLYIAGPYRADTANQITTNIKNAQMGGFIAARQGWVPVVPHNMSIGMEKAGGESWWLRATLKMMAACDAIAVLPGFDSSKGTVAEIEAAQQLGMPIYYFPELPEA